jgi:predicted lipoprotein with Yx(FWY)xxD motif
MFARFNSKTLGLLMLIVAVGLSACASGIAPAVPSAAAQVPAAPAQAPAAAAPAAASAAPAAAGPVVLQVVNNDKLGKFLADGSGMTLYMFTKDTKDVSNCYDKCATAWPPLLQNDKPTLKDGVDGSLLGTTTRKDGAIQVTYKGMPLYYYFKDKAAGDVVGQGNNSVWYVVAPDGSVMK